MTRFADTTAHDALAAGLTRAWRAAAPADEIGWLLQASEELARDNALSFRGGPFGALIVDLTAKEVVGAAANHATLWHDPTAHAEVLALRAASAGRADLSDCVLLTSCECCPMCLAATYRAGIRRIHYHATRQQAAEAGFADAAQYELVAKDLAAQATHLSPQDARHDEAQSHLGDADIVVLTPSPKGMRVIGRATSARPGDPTSTAAIEALRQACGAWKNPRLPAGSRMICRATPGPLSLLAADWANLGHSGDLDDAHKDAGAILYFTPRPASDPIWKLWQTLRDPEEAGMRRVHSPLPESLAFPAWIANLSKLQRY